MCFADFWAIYPKRKGTNPRFPAEKKYLTAIKNGAEEAHIISSAKRYAEELQAQGKLNTEYVCMAQTWINQRRWLDYSPVDSIAKAAELDAMMATKGYIWNGARWEKTEERSI